MIAGRDFPSLFEADNFLSRRTTGHNLYDPECLMAGFETETGMDYSNSRREWPSEYVYLDACEGRLTTDEILGAAPRVFIPRRATLLREAA